MPRTLKYFSLVLLVIPTMLIAALLWNSRENPGLTALLVYCAAGLKQPVEAAAQAYEKEYGVPIQLQYGGSQTLLSNLEIARRGDLWLPADDSYLSVARDKNLIAKVLPIGTMRLVLAVKAGNPRNIENVASLLMPGVKLAQANPDAAASGKLTRETFQKLGQWEELKAHTIVFTGTVNDVASNIKLGAVDAGFIWDPQLLQYPGLVEVKLPELEGVRSQFSVAVLRSSADPAAALKFARYLTARDKGLLEFKRHGFSPIEGDKWSENPELNLGADAMRRPAIEETITTAFEACGGCGAAL